MKKILCVVMSVLLSLCIFAGCSEKDNSNPPPEVNDNMLALVGTWEFSDESGSITYTFSSDGTGYCYIYDYKLPLTYTATETSLVLRTDYIQLYEGLNGMSFDELVAGGYVMEDLRFMTENYAYSLNGDILSITDIAYSAAISDSDLATLELTRVAE